MMVFCTLFGLLVYISSAAVTKASQSWNNIFFWQLSPSHARQVGAWENYQYYANQPARSYLWQILTSLMAEILSVKDACKENWQFGILFVSKKYVNELKRSLIGTHISAFNHYYFILFLFHSVYLWFRLLRERLQINQKINPHPSTYLQIIYTKKKKN